MALCWAVFAAAAAVLFYTWVGYPLLVACAARLRPRRAARSPQTATLSVIIAAKNEEQNIG